jgi:RNA polymerase sigma factor (TIGR02999 family)
MSGNITELLLKWSNGDKEAVDELIPLVYDELHRLAYGQLRYEFQNQSLQPTALINEAYIRLVNWEDVDWKNRAHFLGVAAQLMRNILVDYARKRIAAKRGGADQQRISLNDALGLSDMRSSDLLALDDALSSLSKIDPQQSRIIELRYFGGLTCKEAGEVLGISAATVNREEFLAKHWLLRELSNKQSQDSDLNKR